jgi:hypothetical protein
MIEICVDKIQTAIPVSDCKSQLLFDWKNGTDYEILED